ncbi:hypothetical protein HAX54_042545 [Datura stramonium]|uniref:Uncharacterized protein n=1 Tax=Datura stramonium TaxID=4076 RepID=A0ABS8SME0_DATST|nr:hypothetical protein [Datura stramonium]
MTSMNNEDENKLFFHFQLSRILKEILLGSRRGCCYIDRNPVWSRVFAKKESHKNEPDASLVLAPSKSNPSTSSTPPMLDHSVEILAKLTALDVKLDSFTDILVVTPLQMEKVKNVTKEVGTDVSRIRIKLDQVMKRPPRFRLALRNSLQLTPPSLMP